MQTLLTPLPDNRHEAYRPISTPWEYVFNVFFLKFKIRDFLLIRAATVVQVLHCLKVFVMPININFMQRNEM